MYKSHLVIVKGILEVPQRKKMTLLFRSKIVLKNVTFLSDTCFDNNVCHGQTFKDNLEDEDRDRARMCVCVCVSACEKERERQ